MPKFLPYALDFAALALLYFLLLRPRWKRSSRSVLAANALLFLYLCGVLLVTLMPVLTSLPFCFSHPYVPMHMVPFEAALKSRGDFLRQIVLNVVMTVPFGVLYPLSPLPPGRRQALLPPPLPAHGPGPEPRH